MERLTQKQESFCLNLFKGMYQRDAYIDAYHPIYSMATIDGNASRLANNEKILTRLEELRQKAEDATIADVVERKQVLTEIVRGRFADFMAGLTPEKLKSAALQEIKVTEHGSGNGKQKTTAIKLHNPVHAIDTLNKMDKLYSDGAVVNVDNRKVEIYVTSEEGKRLTEQILAGEGT